MCINGYLRDQINDWCERNGNKPFVFSDVFGKENRNWGGTPLQQLYYRYGGVDGQFNIRAYRAAASKAGKLLRTVIDEMGGFDVHEGYRVQYKRRNGGERG